jgi:predicted nucleotidyltransferase
MSVNENQLITLSKPPSETEEEKCRNAVDRITKAISLKFGSSVSIFLQGSYKNRTNVKIDSDVDIVVRHNGYYFGDTVYLTESEKQLYNQIPNATYTFNNYKSDIHKLLEEEFEYGEVERKDKCINVHENSYRVNADVVPCFVHKRLQTHISESDVGIELITDKGQRIFSFPQQHFENGAKKNNDTDTMYKSVVRILKNARNSLVDQSTITDKAMPSFFLECLVWNVPNQNFERDTYLESTKSIIQTIWNDMGNITKYGDYAEVSDLKWLFKGNTNRTPEQAKSFMEQVWTYLGFD